MPRPRQRLRACAIVLHVAGVGASHSTALLGRARELHRSLLSHFGLSARTHPLLALDTSTGSAAPFSDVSGR